MSDAKDPAACVPGERYDPAAFRSAPSTRARTAYIVGGLYGNPEALQAIRRMQTEEARRGVAVGLVFNGDHNWLDIDAADFWQINDAVLSYPAIRGNVETAFGAAAPGDCGCNYPAHVDPGHVERSNAIMARLGETARLFPGLRRALAALPPIRVLEVGGLRVGICHGDAEALAGWAFAAEHLGAPAACGECAAVQPTPAARLQAWFRAAGVDAFACTHTCLPRAVSIDVDGSSRLIVNNGAAGMPNFAGARYGVITRVSVERAAPAGALYGTTLRGVRFDAVPVPYDHEAWLARFLRNWPAGSPAHAAYLERIVEGPRYALGDAIGPGFTASGR